MKKIQRVPKGEKYWYLKGNLEVAATTDIDSYIDASNWLERNHFHTEEEARSMLKKLRAVLKGADVIEMPSDEEIQKVLSEKIPIHGGRTYGESLNYCWFEEGIHWLRDNKIVK